MESDAATVEPETRPNFYRQIVKSSSIVGGSQTITLLIGMAKTKAVALLLGPTGVGNIGLLIQTQQMLGMFSGLGIGTSGVREIADANATGDAQVLSRRAVALRRLSWLTGCLGVLIATVSSRWLSLYMFGNTSWQWHIAALGVAILLNQLSLGQAALIQGTRRIGDLARQGILGASASAVISVVVYKVWGQQGIIPVILLTGLCTLAFSWYFAHRVPLEPTSLSWPATFGEGRRMVSLGLAFMVSGIISTGVSWLIQSAVNNEFGPTGTGIYNAAWALSFQFAGFILSAMGSDFYPRLCGASKDHRLMNQMVNEQTEIGILLALPGLIATLTFAPWVVVLFYRSDFAPAAILLPWFVLGVFGRVVSWPMAYIQLALGHGRMFTFTEAMFFAMHLGLALLLLDAFGLEGVSISFAVMYGVYVVGMALVGLYLTRFRWTAAVWGLLSVSGIIVTSAFLISRLAPTGIGMLINSLLTAITTGWCYVGFRQRLRKGARNSSS